MKKTALFTLAGLVLIFSGIILFYLFLTGLDSGGNFIFFGVALLTIGGGAYCLVRANKAPKTNTDPLSFSDGTGSNMLEKNNEMLGDYAKTADARDRLKMLETASEKEVL